MENLVWKFHDFIGWTNDLTCKFNQPNNWLSVVSANFAQYYNLDHNCLFRNDAKRKLNENYAAIKPLLNASLEMLIYALIFIEIPDKSNFRLIFPFIF